MTLLLKKFGIDSVILEKATVVSPHPKAHVITSRTMEIMKELNLEKEILDRAPPIEQWTSFRY
jgi:2,4-dichlorophenol 6-monooxygenase